METSNFSNGNIEVKKNNKTCQNWDNQMTLTETKKIELQEYANSLVAIRGGSKNALVHLNLEIIRIINRNCELREEGYTNYGNRFKLLDRIASQVNYMRGIIKAVHK